MTPEEIINVIQNNSLTVRCLPHTVTSLYSYKEGQKIKENQEVIFSKEWKRNLLKEIRTVKNGGWWYVKETADTNSTVRFSREYDKFFAPTLEEAIKLYLDSKL